MTEPLTVRLSGEELGELLPDATVRWRDDWSRLAPLNARVLSHSLPFGADGMPAGPFFGGLLPEGVGLERLAQEARVASNDIIGLLAEVGADVGGSVTIGEPRPPREPLVIDETEYDRILERAAGYIRGSSVGGGGSSATGVQPKVALTWDPHAERWLMGRGSRPSTHLLKPVPNEHSARVRAEAYLNDVAKALGLSSHDARIEAAGERTVLVVERYDRRRTSDAIVRIHQEDAAQALGLPWGGNDKYESVNPRASLANIARLVGGSALSNRATGRDRLLALTTLNIVAGNTDAHAKNFSVLLPELADAFRAPAEVRLADAYDIVPQVLFTSGASDPLAMRVDGESAPGSITAEHLVREAERWGIPSGRAASVVDDTLRELVAAVEALGLRHGVSASLPAFLLEQSGNLRRGDRAWTRPLPPAIAFD
jgi:serine/threonine-protein kinase HipA